MLQKSIPFQDVNVYLISTFMFHIMSGRAPSLLLEYLLSNREVYRYNTRQALHLHVPIRTNLDTRNIRYRGTVIWNSLLNLCINPEISEAVFLEYVKRLIDQDILISLRTCVWLTIIVKVSNLVWYECINNICVSKKSWLPIFCHEWGDSAMILRVTSLFLSRYFIPWSSIHTR